MTALQTTNYVLITSFHTQKQQILHGSKVLIIYARLRSHINKSGFVFHQPAASCSIPIAKYDRSNEIYPAVLFCTSLELAVDVH